MSISPLNRPINVLVCKTDGTIFSGNPGGGGGSALTFSNLGATGATVYAQTIANNVQFRRISQGNNVVVTQRANDILLDVNDLAFDSTPAVKRAIPGLQGISLGKSGILATLQELLYPIIAPLVSLSLDISQFEYGDTSNINATWGVTRTDEPILTIQVGATSESVTGNTQNGVQAVPNPGTGSVTVILVATTATKSANTSRQAIPSRKIRMGATNKDGTVAILTDLDINGLQGFFSPGRALAPQTIVVGLNQYLAIEIPTIYSGTPIFKINGFVTNAFTKTRSAVNFTNNFGFTEQVDLYVSNAFSTGTITVEIV